MRQMDEAVVHPAEQRRQHEQQRRESKIEINASPCRRSRHRSASPKPPAPPWLTTVPDRIGFARIGRRANPGGGQDPPADRPAEAAPPPARCGCRTKPRLGRWNVNAPMTSPPLPRWAQSAAAGGIPELAGHAVSGLQGVVRTLFVGVLPMSPSSRSCGSRASGRCEAQRFDLVVTVALGSTLSPSSCRNRSRSPRASWRWPC